MLSGIIVFVSLAILAIVVAFNSDDGLFWIEVLLVVILVPWLVGLCFNVWFDLTLDTFFFKWLFGLMIIVILMIGLTVFVGSNAFYAWLGRVFRQ